jgi:Holliday junction resolvasome RuvABC endonuclease subunit
MRYLRVRRYLAEALLGVDAVAYEEVRHHAGVDAAHIYGGIVAVIAAECEERSVPYRGVNVTTVKKRATGKGNAGKEAMVTAFTALVGRPPESDDEADALFVALTLADELA